MDLKLLDDYVNKTIQEGNIERYKELTKMCVPYLLHLRKKFGFFNISDMEIKHELASDAIADSIIIKEKRGLPFSICLQNTFRDRCRQRNRIIRDQNVRGLMARHRIPEVASAEGFISNIHPVETQFENIEQTEIIYKILDDHDPFSKKIIYQRMQGSSYCELSDIFSTTLKECKKVYWHDIYHIRKEFNQNHDK